MINVKYKKRGRPKKKDAAAKDILEKLINSEPFKSLADDIARDLLIFGFVSEKRLIKLMEKHGI